jgi:hypothetical protein
MLKIHLLIHLYILNVLWTGPRFLDKSGAISEEFLRLRILYRGLRVDI